MKPMNACNLKLFFCLLLASVFYSGSVQAIDADAAKAFAKQNNCFRCHGVDKDKDGPAWNKIAAKYKDDPNKTEKIIHHLSSGETAKFPDGHEEAHMILKSDDAAAVKNLVEWLLSLP